MKYGHASNHSSAILETAKERDIHWLIMGNRGSSRVRSFFLGSTASSVLEITDIPVLLINVYPGKVEKIRSEIMERYTQRALIHLLHPTDFSGASEKAFYVMKHLIAQKTKSVTFIHVADKRENHLKQLKELASSLSYPDHLKVNLKMPGGNPDKEILNEIDHSKVTLVVMGTRGRGYKQRKFRESISYRVAAQCKTPILFVPYK
ncbi:MAG: universal stress protein, partial [Balneolaceae bacterium]